MANETENRSVSYCVVQLSSVHVTSCLFNIVFQFGILFNAEIAREESAPAWPPPSMDAPMLNEDFDDDNLAQLKVEVESLEMKVRKARAKDDLEQVSRQRSEPNPFESEPDVVCAFFDGNPSKEHFSLLS